MANSDFDWESKLIEESLTSFFRQRGRVSGYLQSVRNTNLDWVIPDKKPSWFDNLATEINSLRANGQEWFNSVAPSMTSLPQNYIDFADDFSAQLPTLTTVIEALIGSKENQDVDSLLNDVSAIFDEWIATARTQKDSVAQLDNTIASLLKELNGSIDSLKKGAKSVNDDLKSEQAQVTAIKTKLDELQAQLESDLAAEEAAAIGAGAALVVLVLAIVVVAAEPGVGSVLTAIGAAVGLTAGAVVAVSSGSAVAADQEKILKEQAELTEASRQVVILNGIATTANGLLQAYSDKRFSLTDLKNSWTTLEENLQTVKEAVIADRGYADGLKAILADLKNFGGTLDTITAFCTNLQDSALQGDATPIQVITVQQATAA